MSHIARVVAATALLTESVRAAGSIPNGHLYAAMLPYLPKARELDTYEVALRVAIGAGLVRRDGLVLRWIGPIIHDSAATH